MPKFRKKPVEIEAWQWDGSWQGYAKLLAAAGEPDEIYYAETDGPPAIEIVTLEGTMTAQKGDWIIRGIKGELYPCKPDIFAATYDAVG